MTFVYFDGVSRNFVVSPRLIHFAHSRSQTLDENTHGSVKSAVTMDIVSMGIFYELSKNY